MRGGTPSHHGGLPSRPEQLYSCMHTTPMADASPWMDILGFPLSRTTINLLCERGIVTPADSMITASHSIRKSSINLKRNPLTSAGANPRGNSHQLLQGSERKRRTNLPSAGALVDGLWLITKRETREGHSPVVIEAGRVDEVLRIDLREVDDREPFNVALHSRAIIPTK